MGAKGPRPDKPKGARASSRVPAAYVPDFHKAVGKDIRRIALRMLILYKLAHKVTNYYSLVKDIQGMQKKMQEKQTAGSPSMWMDRTTASSPAMIKSEIYNIISALEKSKYITFQKRATGSRIIKYYKITPSGIEVLKETQEVLTRSVKEISKIIGE